MATITSDNVQDYIDKRLIDPKKLQIDVNLTKTASDPNHKWISLESAIKGNYDFKFDYNVPEVRTSEMLPEITVVVQKKFPKIEFIPEDTEQNLKHRNKVTKADAVTKEATAFEKPLNFLSPGQWFGAYVDYLQNQTPFWKGIYDGNSGWVSDDFATKYPRLSVLFNMLGDSAATYGIGKVRQYGNTPIIKYGTETPIVSYTRFSPRVTKYTNIPPSEMHIRNQIPKFAKSTFKGIDNGIYVYTQPRIWFPKNPKFAFNNIIKNAMNKGYKIITHPNMEGVALFNKHLNRVVSDFGLTGKGQIGWTWRGPRMGDMAIETYPEWIVAMERNGGQIKKQKQLIRKKNAFRK